MREGGRFDHEPIVVFGTHVIRKKIFRDTPMLFGAPQVEVRTSQPEVRKKMFYVFFKLKD